METIECKKDEIMEEKMILPQNTRLMGALLGFIGGGLDVFCHMHYRSLVATQTGNLLLLIADLHDPNVTNTIMRFSSIFFFFDRLSCGFAYQGISQNRLLANQDAHPLICCHFVDSPGILETAF